MQPKPLKPRKAINKAFLKIKPNRTEIEHFKTNLIELLDRTNDTESEEFHKNLVSDFLKRTYYEPNHFINTKSRNDLVIHNGKKANTTVGVIIKKRNFSLYPNPTDGKVALNMSDDSEIHNITIADISGKQILKIDAKNIKEIDLTNFEQGMYLLNIETNLGVFTRKIIKD